MKQKLRSVPYRRWGVLGDYEMTPSTVTAGSCNGFCRDWQSSELPADDRI
jgi:hypothetical protein